jgi:membrane-associated phospholipid phosphatase
VRLTEFAHRKGEVATRLSHPSRTRLQALVAALCFTLLLPASSPRAEDRNEPAGTTNAKWPGPWEQFPPAWEAAARTTGADALYLLTSPLRLTAGQAAVVGAVGAGIFGLSLLDRTIREEARHPREDSLRDTASAITQLGFGPVLFGFNVGMVVVGEGIRESRGDPQHLNTALVAAEAQLLALAFSQGIAFSTARSRPPGSSDPFRFEFGSASFPSSHASQAFAVAAVFADRYPQPVPAIAYGLAGLIGASRLVLDKHWASDVVAGSVLGWAIGKTLSARHSRPHGYLDFFPFADPVSDQYGVVFSKAF